MNKRMLAVLGSQRAPKGGTLMRLARLLPLFAVLLLVSCFSAQADEPLPNRPDAGGGQSVDIGVALPPRKGSPKLESSLARVVEAFQRGDQPAPADGSSFTVAPLADGRVRVIVEAAPGRAEDAAALARSLEATVETSYGDLVQVSAPIGALQALASSDAVRFVRQPYVLEPAVVSEGVPIINADDWQAAGLNGSGVKMAVLDLGFQGYTSLLGTELPASVTTRSFRADGDITGGGEVHGAAVAEIVHDVAPDAQMYLVNQQTDVEFLNAVDWLIAQDVDVINFSAGWPVIGRGDGTGYINQKVSQAVSSGVVWANAMGNMADAHWMGNWSDPNSNNWHNFASNDETNTFATSAGSPMRISLKWDDVFGASSNDYDLCLLDSSLAIIVCSASRQNGDDDPVEWIAGTAPYTGTYHIGIGRYSATRAVHFHLYIYPAYPMQYVVAAGSLAIPADNPSAISVGAVPWSSPSTIEPFSSQGPTEDGRTKPDLVAPDCVSGASYGPTGFCGTSAASPHVAGAAALVKQAYPSYTPTQIKSFLESRAVDLGVAGKDNIYGSGRLNLGTPPIPDLVITKTASPADGSNVSTGATITYTLTASNSGGATATNVVIRDYIGTGLTFVSATPGSGVTCGDITPPEINCTAASIAPGESRTVTIVATVSATSGTVLNGARVDPTNAIAESNEDADDPDRDCAAVGEGTDAADPTEPDNFDCTGHTVTVQPDLTVTKTASPADGSNVSTGATITYTLTASNSGGATATNVPIRDILGTGLTYVSATGSGVTCTHPSAQQIDCTVASLALGASATVTITATVAATSGTVLNGARVDPANVIAESNEAADDPDRDCTAVGEGTDPPPGTEPDNFDCTGHTVTVQACGDVNCDGQIDAVDALFVLQYVVGLRDGSNECPAPAGAMYLPACDVDCDYDCDAVDALFVLQYVVGIRPDLCVCLGP